MESALISPVISSCENTNSKRVYTSPGMDTDDGAVLQIISSAGRSKEQDKKNNTLLIAIWSITFLIVGFYQFLLQPCFYRDTGL